MQKKGGSSKATIKSLKKKIKPRQDQKKERSCKARIKKRKKKDQTKAGSRKMKDQVKQE